MVKGFPKDQGTSNKDPVNTSLQGLGFNSVKKNHKLSDETYKICIGEIIYNMTANMVIGILF